MQAINDFVLFSIAGAGSLISGFMYATLGWLVLIYVVSVLMVIYLLMFVTAWGGKGVDDGMEAPLLGNEEDGDANEADRMESVATDITVRVTRVEEGSIMGGLRGASMSSQPRGVSMSRERVRVGSFSSNRGDGRSGSFLTRLDGRLESTDDMTPVRSMSVT
ncbi:hypothetical protein EON64_06255 [archaeon]|nr:MAG: hypothetical protein EON64_06255 [archaeon]